MHKTVQLNIYQVFRRAKNQERILKHGWYLVKNRSSTETKANISLEESRKLESALFAEGAWRPSSSGIHADRLGIYSLRSGLSHVFCAHIRAEFPAFIQQTRTILNQKRVELAALGPARNTLMEQRDFLKSIVDLYQPPKDLCLIEDFRSSLGTQEAGLALERRLAIKKKMILKNGLIFGGEVWTFQVPAAEKDEWSDQAASMTFNAGTRNIYTWINHRYQETKSCAMPGLVPYPLIERLFEEQTAKWNTITDSFVESVKMVFISAVAHCLRIACTNDSILAGLNRLLLAEIEAKMNRFKLSCYSLIMKERKGMHVIAREEQFIKDIREARTLRFISAIAKLEDDAFLSKTNFFSQSSTSTAVGLFANVPDVVFGQSASKSSSNSAVSPSSLSQPVNPPTKNASEVTPPKTGLFANLGTPKPETINTTFRSFAEFAKNNQAKLTEVLTHERQLVYDIHDILKAYYKISMQHYTDMVCKNELNPTFAVDIMNIFSKNFIDRLSDTDISEIAAEGPADRKKRRELKEDIEKLEMAISESEKILNQKGTD
jgi:hypothetical protein